MAKDSLKRKFEDSDTKVVDSALSAENYTDSNYIDELSDDVRSEFMTLGKDKANKAAYHYIQVFLYLEENPKLALKEAQKLVSISSRIGTFRELLGICSYYNDDFDTAIKELKAARRINGAIDYTPIIADSYRGLKQPEKVVELAKEDYVSSLPTEIHAEMAIVLAGAFFDLGQHESCQKVLSHELTNPRLPESLNFRVLDASMNFYEAAGNEEEAAKLHETQDARRGEFEHHTDTRNIALDLLEKE